MNNLHVHTWQSWEVLCQWWIRDIAAGLCGARVDYQRYGAGNESQHGVDLVPQGLDNGIVAQCKFFQSGVLKWPVIAAEIERTHSYPGRIDHYFVLADAPRNAELQQRLITQFMVQRRNGGQFQLHLRYWEDVASLDFLPDAVKRKLFPDAYHLAEGRSLEGDDVRFARSLYKLRDQIPRLITQTHLKWLETWDFSCGYVRTADFNEFHDLKIDYGRVQLALGCGQPVMYEESRQKLAETLPAAEPFVEALQHFVTTITAHSIGANLPDGTDVLELDRDWVWFHWECRRWTSAAGELAETYRTKVLGETI